MPLDVRTTLALDTSASRSGEDELPAVLGPAAAFERGTAAGASAKVFHASHAGQRPSHRDDSCPQAEQKKSERTLATTRRGYGENAPLLRWSTVSRLTADHCRLQYDRNACVRSLDARV